MKRYFKCKICETELKTSPFKKCMIFSMIEHLRDFHEEAFSTVLKAIEKYFDENLNKEGD